MKVQRDDGTVEHIPVGSALLGRRLLTIELSYKGVCDKDPEMLAEWLKHSFTKLIPVEWAAPKK